MIGKVLVALAGSLVEVVLEDDGRWASANAAMEQHFNQVYLPGMARNPLTLPLGYAEVLQVAADWNVEPLGLKKLPPSNEVH